MGTLEHDRAVAEMFDRVAPRYDLLNRVLSFGADRSWRRRAVALARLGGGERAVDVGVGTGDLAHGLLRASDPRSDVIGVDLSPAMLALSVRRLASSGGRYRPVVASAASLPLPDASVDRVVAGFTVRNVGDLPAVLREFRRVLRPGGRAVILELSHPRGGAFAALYWCYLERVAPRIASALGGDLEAYRYLPRSVRAFPRAEGLSRLLSEAGFAEVRAHRLTFGIAAIHIAARPRG